MVIPIYASVCNKDGQPIGFAGAAFLTGELEKSLEQLTDEDSRSGISYSLFNASNQMYIMNEDKDLVGKKCDDQALLTAAQELSAASGKEKVKSLVQKDRVSVYYYMASRNWVFVVTYNHKAVFGLIEKIRTMLVAICVFMTVLMMGVCMILLRKQMQPLNVINSAIIRLKSNDFRQNEKLEKCCALENEYGTIANAVQELHSVMEQQYVLFKEMFEVQMAGTLVTTDNNTQIVMINQEAMELYGLDPAKKDSLTMDDVKAHFDKNQLEAMDNQLEEEKDSGEDLSCEATINHDDGNIVHVLMHAKRTELSNGKAVQIFSLMDITAQKNWRQTFLFFPKPITLLHSATGVAARRKSKTPFIRGSTDCSVFLTQTSSSM